VCLKRPGTLTLDTEALDQQSLSHNFLVSRSIVFLQSHVLYAEYQALTRSLLDVLRFSFDKKQHLRGLTGHKTPIFARPFDFVSTYIINYIGSARSALNS